MALRGAETLKKKKAVITVELVAESMVESDEKIVKELLEWFRDDALYVPWVKTVKSVIVEDN